MPVTTANGTAVPAARGVTLWAAADKSSGGWAEYAYPRVRWGAASGDVQLSNEGLVAHDCC
jgi:hypothetical protein